MADEPPRIPARPPPTRQVRACPVCGRRPPDPAFRPFCSARCRQVDLGRWLAGDYAVPGEPLGEEDGEEGGGR